MATATALNPQGSTLGPQVAQGGVGRPGAISYPTLVPSAPVGKGVGLPARANGVNTFHAPSDARIRGALAINPAFAGDYLVGEWSVEFPNPGNNEPPEVKSKTVTQTLATGNSPNAWKMRESGSLSNEVLFGSGPPQAPLKNPWIKQFIPPLSLFNDASQWVNRLMFNQPMVWYGAVECFYPLKAQYFTPKPIETNNLAAGTLNLQLQLGTIANQAAQLTMAASNYYGGM